MTSEAWSGSMRFLAASSWVKRLLGSWDMGGMCGETVYRNQRRRGPPGALPLEALKHRGHREPQGRAYAKLRVSVGGGEPAECRLHRHVFGIGELVDFAVGVEGEELIFSGPHFAARALFADAYELSGNAIERGKRD